MREHYCDGLGDCLPACPTNAITFVEREAAAYDEAFASILWKDSTKAAQAAKQAASNTANQAEAPAAPVFHGCPGSRMRSIQHKNTAPAVSDAPAMEGQLTNWPVQIKLAPLQAPYFEGANLLVAIYLWEFPSGIYPQPCLPHWLPETGCRRLHRKTDRDHQQK